MTLTAETHPTSRLPYWFGYPRRPDQNVMSEVCHGIETWCEEQFGPTHDGHADDIPRWEPHGSMMCIRDEIDAAVFKMRWC